MVKVETSIGSFDIVNPSDGVFDDPSRFLSETYIHIRKVSESNTDETPAPSPTGQPKESCFDAMTSRNPRTHYGRFSTFTGHSSEGFPHKCSAKTDGRFQSTHPRWDWTQALSYHEIWWIMPIILITRIKLFKIYIFWFLFLSKISHISFFSKIYFAHYIYHIINCFIR